MSSSNGNLILEPYKGSKKLEAEVKKGFATVKARSTLIGLKLIEDAEVILGGTTHTIEKGSVLYFREESLATGETYTKKYTVEGEDGEFVIGNYNDIIKIGK